ncbi:stromal membrane-associated protein [Acrasis kona]|uniref:Stromal membrane-associated protein n=1 Tax=Acrasis kona TaxID=1008807 RepID=A0AAW2YVY5_9EUKA
MTDILTIRSQPSNSVCCDCESKDLPTWASTNIGCFLCIQCSGVHRSLGTHISKIKSLTLDLWTESEVASMKGNLFVNQVYEANVPVTYPKPLSSPDVNDYRKEFIKAKYELKAFSCDKLSTSLPTPKFKNVCKEEKPEKKKGSNLRKTMKFNRVEGRPTTEFEGYLTIKLKCGRNLPSRDINGKSDPYVFFGVGPDENDSTNLYAGQVVKSEVQKKTLNPDWNQEMNVCVVNVDSDVLHLECWDWDKITYDDFMGNYHIRLKDHNLRHNQQSSFEVNLENTESGSISMDIRFHSLKN